MIGKLFLIQISSVVDAKTNKLLYLKICLESQTTFCFVVLTIEQCVYCPKQSINSFCPLSVYVYIKSHDLMFLLTLEYCQFAPTCQMGKLKYRFPLFLCTKAQPL